MDGLYGQIKGRSVVQVEANVHLCLGRGGIDIGSVEVQPGILDGGGGGLDHHRRLHFLGGGDDGHDHLHVFCVERTDGVAALLGIEQHLLTGDVRHSGILPAFYKLVITFLIYP